MGLTPWRQDLLSAEKQLVAALPKVAEAAHSPELKNAISEHLAQTRGHVQRLEKVTGILGMDASSSTCKAMGSFATCSVPGISQAPRPLPGLSSTTSAPCKFTLIKRGSPRPTRERRSNKPSESCKRSEATLTAAM